jgi:ABC-type sulfate transport system substrate-binding protein
LNAVFTKRWLEKTGQPVEVQASHDGSGSRRSRQGERHPQGLVTQLYKNVPVLDSGARGDDVFGGWAKAQADNFDDGGVFDQICQPGG